MIYTTSQKFSRVLKEPSKCEGQFLTLACYPAIALWRSHWKISSYHSSLFFFTWSHWNNSSYHSSHFYFTLFHNNSVKNLKLEKFHFKFIRNSKLLVQEEVQNYNSTVWILFLLGSTPCKVEQPLRDMKL